MDIFNPRAPSPATDIYHTDQTGPTNTPCFCRTLVLVEGDARLRTYDDAEGKSRTSLNVIQRMSPSSFIPQHPSLMYSVAGYIEVLKRPFNADQESQQ